MRLLAHWLARMDRLVITAPDPAAEDQSKAAGLTADTINIGCTCGGKQGFCLGDVTLRDRQLLDVIRICRGDPLVSHLVLAVEDDLVERLAILGSATTVSRL